MEKNALTSKLLSRASERAHKYSKSLYTFAEHSKDPYYLNEAQRRATQADLFNRAAFNRAIDEQIHNTNKLFTEIKKRHKKELIAKGIGGTALGVTIGIGAGLNNKKLKEKQKDETLEKTALSPALIERAAQKAKKSFELLSLNHPKMLRRGRQAILFRQEAINKKFFTKKAEAILEKLAISSGRLEHAFFKRFQHISDLKKSKIDPLSLVKKTDKQLKNIHELVYSNPTSWAEQNETAQKAHNLRKDLRYVDKRLPWVNNRPGDVNDYFDNYKGKK